MVKASSITKKGNVLGFTVNGEAIIGCYRSKIKAWRIDIVSKELGIPILTDSRNRTLPTRGMAADYANTLINEIKTKELSWWN